MSNRLLVAVLLGLVVASQAGFAADDNAGSADTAAQDRSAATDSGDHHCDDAVSLFYLGNPAASGGFYNNPWADCKAPPSSR
jgi:hypothetical protein